MTARMQHPAMLIPSAMQPLQALSQAAKQGGVAEATLQLVHLRTSQINGCSVCVDLAFRQQSGEGMERLFAVSAWRDAPYFTEAERAALALAEAVTRLADHPDPVPEAVWAEAARHYDEKGLAALLIMIAATNVWNRLNAATRQVAGEWAKSHAGKAGEWAKKSS